MEKQMKRSEKDSNMTSFHGVTIRTTVKALLKVLGEPAWANNTGEDKTNFDWIAETSDGRVVTLYDWKMYRPLRINELVDFHIGGFDLDSTQKAKEELLQQLPSYLTPNGR
jgi:hypothetical protein